MIALLSTIKPSGTVTYCLAFTQGSYPGDVFFNEEADVVLEAFVFQAKHQHSTAFMATPRVGLKALLLVDGGRSCSAWPGHLRHDDGTVAGRWAVRTGNVAACWAMMA